VADIFLSYKREDRDRAQRIEHALTKQGWNVFWDRELLPGETFRVALEKELNEAKCVIVLWSEASVTSNFVADEASQGLESKKLVSVKIDAVAIPLGFRQLQHADLIGWTGDAQDPNFQLLVQGVARKLRLPDLSPAPGPVVTDEVVPPPPTPPTPPPPPVTPPTVRAKGQMVRPTLLLAAVFLLNWVETSLDAWLTPSALGAQAGYPITYAFRWFEGYLSFASHDVTNTVASHGYTFSYFFILPLVCLFVAWDLARRDDPRPYRAVSLAVAINYLVSLPFFLFFPVPERWSFFESEAMLLSDKWSDKLIEAIRPISGLDNSFPSNHVSLIVLVVTACFIFEVPLRKCVLPLGATVVLSTFVLGIHWIPDMLAGLALGVASMLLAWRVTRAGRLSFLWGAA